MTHNFDSTGDPNIAPSRDNLELQLEEKQALRELGLETKSPSRPELSPRSRFIILVLTAVCLTAALLYFASRMGASVFLRNWADVVETLLLGSAASAGVVLLARLSEEFILGRVEANASRFNLKRIFRLFAGLVLALVILSLIFENWVTALFSLGLMSLILGFALQTPITSFIGWIYILVRTPYRVGDRIKIGDASGDVIDVSYFDTTLGNSAVSIYRPITRVAGSSSFPIQMFSIRPFLITRGRFFHTSGTRLGSTLLSVATWISLPALWKTS